MYHFIYTLIGFVSMILQELYHEEYQSVAVMFASIPNFIEFYRETTGLSREGPSCLRVLNEVGQS